MYMKPEHAIKGFICAFITMLIFIAIIILPWILSIPKNEIIFAAPAILFVVVGVGCIVGLIWWVIFWASGGRPEE